ncbi:MAG: class I SAM-dependent methyltransferase [Marmoricola sp.]
MSTGSSDGDPRPSPNLWHTPDLYELECQAFDPDGLVDQAIRSVADWAGRDVVDVGCGSGFLLPRFATTARSVVGVEPHQALRAIAVRRTRRLANVSLRDGLASDLPLPGAAADLVHARWAYFFGPGCEPGLAELDRVLRPGGAAFVVDNDLTRSTFGAWFRRGFPAVDPVAVERFWAARDWRRIPVLTSWRFDRREDLEAVVRIELPPAAADAALAAHSGTTVDYAVNVWWWRGGFPR